MSAICMHTATISHSGEVSYVIFSYRQGFHSLLAFWAQSHYRMLQHETTATVLTCAHRCEMVGLRQKSVDLLIPGWIKSSHLKGKQ